MIRIHVESPGLLSTVQDRGREGFAAMGVSASGAADAVALRMGNRLVANPQGAAALEMTLLGGTFVFPDGGMIALTGSDFGAVLKGSPVAPWTSVHVAPGHTLSLGHTRSGARCYLCVHGGIVVESFLGSASTHVLSALGGFDGRPLRKGDVLTVGAQTTSFKQRMISPRALDRLAPRKSLRVTSGPQSDWLDQALLDRFYAASYRVSEEADRMGLRLEGAAVPPSSGSEMITEGVSLGAVQVPPGGRPIIVFVEQQTTGGYPKIANVISADLASVGQLRPRDEISFERVSIETARALFIEREELLESGELIVE